MDDRQVNSANDPLHARCLVLDDGTTKLAIVIVDSCMLPRELVEEAKALAEKATAIPPDRMLIAATHTHTAPTSAGIFLSEPDVKYVAFLIEQIAAVIDTAHRQLKPAQIGWAGADNSALLFNRRWKRERTLIPADPFGGTTDQVHMNPGYRVKGLLEPAGPVDPELSVLAVRSRDGKPMALLGNYSLHYVGGIPPLSADYFGAFADRIAQLLNQDNGNGPFVAMMSNGTSADVNNSDFSQAALSRKPGEQVKIVADAAAKTALEAFKKIEWRDHVRLAAATGDVELAVRKPSKDDLDRAEKIGRAKGRESLKGHGRDLCPRIPAAGTIPR